MILLVLLVILFPFPCFADDPIVTPVPIEGGVIVRPVPTTVPIQNMQIIRRPVPVFEPIQTPIPVEDMTIIRQFIPQPPKRTPSSFWGCFRFGMWFQGYY